jgi:ribonuclease D
MKCLFFAPEICDRSTKEEKMNTKRFSHVLVTDQPSLGRLATELEKEPAIAVDLEADSLFHYRDQVCLLQISTESLHILVDPLALKDLSPLSAVFANPHVEKVFHGADNDIRALHRDFGIEVNSLFDTQIAARFLGSRETGLAALLKQKLGVHIDKKYQKKDWSKRPLPPSMLEYAIQDTFYLFALSAMFKEELRTKDRLAWVEEECEILSKVRQVPPVNGPLFLGFKGASRLDGTSLAVLEAILQLRDETARRRNLPPFKILANAPIMEIVKKKPKSKTDLSSIHGLSARQVRILGPAILERTEQAMNTEEEGLPAFPKTRRRQVDRRVSVRVKALKAWRKRRAKEMGIDGSLVCTNAQIDAIAFIFPHGQEELAAVPGLRIWQREVFGEEICALVQDSGSPSMIGPK